MPHPRINALDTRRICALVSVEDLSRAAEANPATYWRWLTDRAKPSDFMLKRFESALPVLIRAKIAALEALLQEINNGPQGDNHEEERRGQGIAGRAKAARRA